MKTQILVAKFLFDAIYQEKHSSVNWTRMFYAQHLLASFFISPPKPKVDVENDNEENQDQIMQTDDLQRRIGDRFPVQVPGCLFDCLDLATNHVSYQRFECCQEATLPATVCALCNLLDLALVSPLLSRKLLTRADNLDAFLGWYHVNC